MSFIQSAPPPPLFDAVASGTPDNWSSSIITWTDAAPRVWRIQRTRPSGGLWSEWGTLEKYSERPAASATFYQGASSAPSTPGTQTGINISTPSDWQTTPPAATASEGVWTTTANRAAGDTQWIFTVPTEETPPDTETEYAYRLHTSGMTAPTFTASANTVPSGWSSTRPSPDPYAPYVWQISRTRPTGGSWSNWGSATVVDTWTASTGSYRDGLKRLGNSYLPPLVFTASSSGRPTGWSSSQPMPTWSNRYKWRISRTRLAGGAWSDWGSG